ncbi:MAG: alpha/beta hydrolase [Erythrobacter sp.]|jgi:pimeloyl-ACP methyl ester carboxylesterase|nr:alpha/beta hydrolase [Erythrobacter sp.]
MSDIRFHDMADGRRIAFRLATGTGPCLVFLPGYMSDMEGSKASALFDDAQAEGRSALLLDYSGCGASSGDFADGTLSRWRDEVLALAEAYVNAPIMLVGSSMGGWLMLLVGEALAAKGRDRLTGMVGIAAAPDFTRWGYDENQRAALAAGETVYEDNPYGPEPTPTHPGFFADAEGHMRLGREIGIECPVRLLHGQRDTDVPWEVSVQLAKNLRSGDVQVCLVKDGDHRLSRDPDIALLKRTISSLM